MKLETKCYRNTSEVRSILFVAETEEERKTLTEFSDDLTRKVLEGGVAFTVAALIPKQTPKPK
jgi:hypothetical protein